MGDRGTDESEFLAVDEANSYGSFDGPPTLEEIDRFFVLDDEDLALIRKRRRDSNRLGFAIQLTTVRFLGRFLENPIAVPAVVIDGSSCQLGITDVSCVNQYVEREKTKREHRREICKVLGWRDYADMTQDLLRWLDHRTWNSGESSQVLFWGAVGWLR